MEISNASSFGRGRRGFNFWKTPLKCVTYKVNNYPDYGQDT